VDLIERHERHAREKRASLAVVAKQLLAEKEFSLKTPVAIDCDGMVEAAKVGALDCYLMAMVIQKNKITIGSWRGQFDLPRATAQTMNKCYSAR